MTIPLDDTQTAILDAVIECLKEHGVSGLTTRRIADAARVNEVTLFRRFGTKAELIKAAYERERTRLHVEVLHTRSVEADLIRVVEGYARILATHGDVVLMTLAEIARSVTLASEFGGPLASFAAVGALLGKHQAEGNLAKEPVNEAASALLGPLLLNYATSKVTGSNNTLNARSFVRHYLKGRSK